MGAIVDEFVWLVIGSERTMFKPEPNLYRTNELHWNTLSLRQSYIRRRVGKYKCCWMWEDAVFAAARQLL